MAAALVLSSGAAFSDASIWRTVKGAFAEFRILADPIIVQDQRLAFVLQDKQKYAETEVREWDAFARQAVQESRAQNLVAANTQNSAEATLRLLGATDRYAAVLTASAECHGSNACFSGEYVTIYRMSDRAKFEGVEALELGGQTELLNRLARRDENITIGQGSIKCDPSNAESDASDDATCQPLSELLGFNDNDGSSMPFKAAQDIKDFAQRLAGVGFSIGPNGRVTTLDIYISVSRQLPAHSRAYKWPIDAKLAAPLLRPALRDLVDSNPSK
jgi:hypothetical protein